MSDFGEILLTIRFKVELIQKIKKKLLFKKSIL